MIPMRAGVPRPAATCRGAVLNTGLGWTRLLLPLVRWRAASVDRSNGSLPRPLDAAHVHCAGHDSDRVLLFGAGAAVGWGAVTHDLALPGALARALSEATGRGADVDAIVDPRMRVSQSVSALRASSLARYDAIVVVLGVNDALQLTPLPRWRCEFSKLLEATVELSLDDTKIIVAGIQPIRSIPNFDTFLGTLADRHANALNSETKALCALSAQAVFVPLASPEKARSDDWHRAPFEYAQWGRALAASLGPILPAQPESRARRRTAGLIAVTEASRQEAVDGLVLRDNGSLARIVDILTLAQRAFHVESATITVLDRDRQWYIAQVGAELQEVSRSSSYCDMAIRGTGPMIVRDARSDERFVRNADANVGPRSLFYAGFPLELPSGERIGTLCVVDSRPRRPEEHIDEDLLRELAMLVQRELRVHTPDSIG
ncbi:MAG: putative diguanylate cyclase [Microbacteriaceae bacterium]|jgi:lysophospholipase L1-like esterase|nr:putative diguanylate cyclase [Microbacteriaceae bacterium]